MIGIDTGRLIAVDDSWIDLLPEITTIKRVKNETIILTCPQFIFIDNIQVEYGIYRVVM